MSVSDVALGDIKVGNRFRTSIGDIQGLADSMDDVGLLHPIVITPDNLLVSGERRLAAAHKLGWSSIPCRRLDIRNILRAEFDENHQRLDFQPSEEVAIYEAVVEEERARARERSGTRTDLEPPGKFPGGEQGQTRDIIARRLGKSGRTLEKAAKVVKAAREDPEVYGDLQERMDSSGKVDGAYKELKKRRKKKSKEVTESHIETSSSTWSVTVGRCSDCPVEDESVDCIVTDPPYPKDYLECFSELSLMAHRALKPGGMCLVMSGQSYLEEVMCRLSENLEYRWTVAYLTPGGQSAQLWDRRVNTFWKPVLVYFKPPTPADWIGDVVGSDTNDNDKRFHKWGQSESGMAALVDRFTMPGELVVDPFLGGGTTGAVCLRLGRRFVGCDIDSKKVKESRERLQSCLK